MNILNGTICPTSNQHSITKRHSRSASLNQLEELSSSIADKVEFGSISLLRGNTLPIYERFIKARKDVEMRACGFLTPISLSSLSQNDIYITIESLDQGGYGINNNKELISLFSKSGIGKILVKDAILRGATHLYCFDCRGLPDFYKGLGFIIDKRYPWNEEYAPDSWDFKSYGRPDLVHMSLKPDTLYETQIRP